MFKVKNKDTRTTPAFMLDRVYSTYITCDVISVTCYYVVAPTSQIHGPLTGHLLGLGICDVKAVTCYYVTR